MGWEEGMGVDLAAAVALKVVEDAGVYGVVLLVGEEREVGNGSDEYVVDAGTGFYSCFTCHGWFFGGYAMGKQRPLLRKDSASSI